jgi:hypothetical protein
MVSTKKIYTFPTITLAKKITACLVDFWHEEQVNPDKTILIPRVYEILESRNLLEYLLLQKLSIYPADKISKRALKELSERTARIDYPLVLCSSSLCNKFSNMSAYNLETEVEMLPHLNL